MGSHDGAEICELVGLHILSKVSDIFGKTHVGLYRDDSLAVIHGVTPSDQERMKKRLCALFSSEFQLKITADANLNVVNFLDITFDLKQSSFRPFRKPGDTPIYINVESNHPPAVIREVPKSISKRISNLSDSEKTFKNSIPMYEKALKDSGFSHT